MSGIPALASDRGGSPESVGPGGILVDPDADLDRWTEVLGRMWDDEAEYTSLAELAERHARRAEFEPRAIAAALLSELERPA